MQPPPALLKPPRKFSDRKFSDRKLCLPSDMSGPSTLATSQPCWGCGALPADGAKFFACTACAQLKLIPCSFCSLECQKEHWPRHEKYHRKARKEVKKVQAVMKAVAVPSLGERDEYETLCDQSFAHMQAGDFQKAGKVARLAIRLEPERPEAYAKLGTVLDTLEDDHGACRNYVLAESVCQCHGLLWAGTIVRAFYLLHHLPDHPRPSWWKDAELLRLSEEALAVGEDIATAWQMRAEVLRGNYGGEDHHPRSAAQYREAARCYTRAAEIWEGKGETANAEKCRHNAATSRKLMAKALKITAERPDVICWGCGAAPLVGPFQACAKCKAEKVGPCVFCSRECQVTHWLRHKEWHREQSAAKASGGSA